MKRIGSSMLAILLVLAGATLSWGASKDTLVIAQTAEPTTLDPHNSSDPPSYNVFMNICENLLQRTEDLKLKPLLADSYKLIDNKTWEFKLRKGIEFHT